MAVPQWTAEREVDAELARALVESQFPDLAPARVERFGVGWDNTAFLVRRAGPGEESARLARDSWVFRFPRRQIAVRWLEQEILLLPAIAPRVPLPVPLPERIGRPEPRYPWPFSGHRMLPGTTACDADLDDDRRSALAEPLGAFLAALHSFPAEEAVSLGARPDEIHRFDVPRRSARARENLAELLAVGLVMGSHVKLLEDVLDCTPVDAAAPRPTLVHGDLYSRHVLVDEQGRPTGIIDWGDVHAGNPAIDVSIAHSLLPAQARDAFRRAYGPIDETTWLFARFRALYHSATITRYANEVGDHSLLREGLGALRRVVEG